MSSDVDAAVLERTAARIDTLVQATAEEIRQLEDRLTRDRRRADFLSGTGRFGDRLAPTGVGRGGDPAVQSSDSTATGRRPLTLEERIQARREDRDRLITIRDQYLLRARAFRERVRTRG